MGYFKKVFTTGTGERDRVDNVLITSSLAAPLVGTVVLTTFTVLNGRRHNARLDATEQAKLSKIRAEFYSELTTETATGEAIHLGASSARVASKFFNRDEKKQNRKRNGVVETLEDYRAEADAMHGVFPDNRVVGALIARLNVIISWVENPATIPADTDVHSALGERFTGRLSPVFQIVVPVVTDVTAEQSKAKV